MPKKDNTPPIMRRTEACPRFSALLAFVCVLCDCPAVVSLAWAEDPQLVAPTGPLTPDDELKLFHLPPGFEIQLVAAEPDINKPMNLAFDERGRLWVTSSVEYPYAAKPGATPRDSIKILEDTDGDGRADRVKTFVDGLNIPIGILPQSAAKGGGCVAHSIPSIYRFPDRDGDDRADSRDALYTGFGFADTHGMSSSYTWGFDGWVYATHGFANNSEVKGSDGHVVKMNSGNTYRFRPDGSRIEQWTWGQVNPFGLTFDPLGNLYSADCHSRPVMMLLRGAYYQSFGKPHDGLGFGPEICTHEHGSTGIAGVVWYAAQEFPREYYGTIFSGNPVTNRINHDRLEQHGSTFVSVHKPDFLSCDDPWFRPVALTLGPDGAIYVADFYNKIIGHYEVPLMHPGRDRERGRIWRIVYKGERPRARPVAPRRDWAMATLDELIEDLGHANLAVRTIATNQIVDRFAKTASDKLRRAVLHDPSETRQVHAMWALERIGSLAVRDDAGPLVRTHWLRAVAEQKSIDASSRSAIAGFLTNPDGLLQRAAADALTRHPAAENIRPLLDARRRISTDDPQLLHTIRMAIREQLRLEGAFESLAKLKLDAIDSSHLADVTTGVPTAHAAEWLLGYLRAKPDDLNNFNRYIAHAARYLPVDREQDILDVAHEAVSPGGDLRRAAAVIQVLHDSLQARGTKPSDYLYSWAGGVGEALVGSGNQDDVREAIRLARAMKLSRLAPEIAKIATGERSLPPLRADAVSMIAETQAEWTLVPLNAILGNAAEPLPLRQHVAGALGQQQRGEVHDILVRHLRNAPDELAVHIAAALAGGPVGADKLLAECGAGKASPRLLQHPLVNGRLHASRARDLDQRIAKLTEGLPPAEDRLQQAIQSRKAGFAKSSSDAQRGSKLFEKHCASCHTLAGRGAKIGPQLDGIGVRGLDRILEDVLDPNRNVDQAFRSSIVALKNGQVLTGLVLNDEGEVLVLADAQGKEIRTPKADVEERTISKLSPMPANVADIMSDSEFYDLVSYLLSQVQAPDDQGSADN